LRSNINGHVAIGWLACQCPNALIDDQRAHRTVFCRYCGCGSNVIG
jgi:hypothetical protein